MISTPREIPLGLLRDKKWSLSSSQYKRVAIANKHTRTIKALLEGREPITGAGIGSDSMVSFETPYRFLRTKAFSPEYFTPNLNLSDAYSFIKPQSFQKYKGNDNQKVVEVDDLLFVTGGSVGEVCIATEELKDTIFSSHIIKLPLHQYKYYVFAFLKHELGKEQANFGPLGSIGGLDSFTIDTLMNIEIPFPEGPEAASLISEIEGLVKTIINEESLIRKKSESIYQIIDDELRTNQGDTNFTYVYPTYKDIADKTRLDTGLYRQDYQAQRFIIQNYKYGANDLQTLGYNITRGQNLQVSSIGRSFYTSEKLPGAYKLILSKDFTEWLTYYNFRFLGNSHQLKTIKAGDIIFSCRGDLGRLYLNLETEDKLITNIDNVHITNDKASRSEKVFISMFFSYLRRKGYLQAIAINGSGANSFTKPHFKLLEIPNFPQNIKQKIARIYQSGSAADSSRGICEIAASLTSLEHQLEKKVEAIIGKA